MSDVFSKTNLRSGGDKAVSLQFRPSEADSPVDEFCLNIVDSQDLCQQPINRAVSPNSAFGWADSLLVLCLIITFTSCRRADDPRFDKSGVLEATVQGIILPHHLNFQSETVQFSDAVAAFVAQPDSIGLTTVRGAFLECNLAWKRCEMFELGKVMDAHLFTRIGKWPTNTTQIEEEIAGTDSLDADHVEQIGSSAKGLPAIEYLLFEESFTTALAQLSTDSAATRRQDYLLALAQNLAEKAEELYQIWAPQGANFGEEFAQSTATGIEDPLALLVNGMIEMLEQVTKRKLGTPFGKFNLGVLQLEAFEAYRSETSLELLIENMRVVEAVYLGPNGEDGIYSILEGMRAKHEQASLAAKIAAQFTTTLNALAAIPSPIENTIVTQHDAIENAYQQCKALIVLFKSDVCSTLSITVTVSDADGD